MLPQPMVDQFIWLFWNADERRLRAGWRILVQLFFLFGLTSGLSAAFRRVAEMQAKHVEGVFAQAPLFLTLALVISVSVWLACRYLDRRPFDDLGMRIDGRWWREAAFGAVLGALLMSGILAAELAFGWANYAEAPDPPGPAPRLAFVSPTLFVFLAVGFYEELVSRGYHLTNLAEGLVCRWIPPRSAVVLAAFLSAAVFGLAHAGNPHATAMSSGNIVLAGMMLATGYVTTGRLAIPMGIHFSWNFCQNLFGMPVSGQTTFFYGSLLIRDVSADPLLTGGAFGPEAGLTGLVAMFVGIGATLAWVRWTTGELKIHASIAALPPSVRASLPSSAPLT